jgi:hypothetical protein
MRVFEDKASLTSHPWPIILSLNIPPLFGYTSCILLAHHSTHITLNPNPGGFLRCLFFLFFSPLSAIPALRPTRSLRCSFKFRQARVRDCVALAFVSLWNYILFLRRDFRHIPFLLVKQIVTGCVWRLFIFTAAIYKQNFKTIYDITPMFCQFHFSPSRQINPFSKPTFHDNIDPWNNRMEPTIRLPGGHPGQTGDCFLLHCYILGAIRWPLVSELKAVSLKTALAGSHVFARCLASLYVSFVNSVPLLQNGPKKQPNLYKSSTNWKMISRTIYVNVDVFWRKFTNILIISKIGGGLMNVMCYSVGMWINRINFRLLFFGPLCTTSRYTESKPTLKALMLSMHASTFNVQVKNRENPYIFSP